MVLFLLLSDCLETLKWEAVSAPYAGLCARGRQTPRMSAVPWLVKVRERMELMRQAVENNAARFQELCPSSSYQLSNKVG